MGFLGLNKPPQEAGAAWPAILVGAFAAFGGVLYVARTFVSHVLRKDVLAK